MTAFSIATFLVVAGINYFTYTLTKSKVVYEFNLKDEGCHKMA
jgi:hypothetical protein